MKIEEKKIPNNWVIEKLGNLCDVVRGGSPRPMGDPKYFSGKIPFLKIADVTKIDGKFVYDAETKVNETGAEKSRLLKKGALVLTNSGTVCVPKFLGVDACIHDGFVSFQNLITKLDWDFLFHYFNYSRPYVIQKHKQGITQVNLNTDIVKNFDFPFPPLPEQRAIVAKIEQLFSELDSGVENLKKAQAQLKVYRQAVLKWAFEGKLTEEWRKQQNDLPTAETLLAQIKAERVEQAEKNGKQLKPNAPISDEELAKLPKLPEGWSWVKIDLLHKNEKHAIKAGPFGSSLKKEFYVESGFKIYGQEQVIAGDSTIGDYFINEEKYKELESCKIEPNDILISLVGTIGKVLILPEDCLPGIINPRLIKISLNRQLYLPIFFKYYFESSFLKRLYKVNTSGTTMDVMNLGIIIQLPFPFCSLPEQNQIVQEIEDRLSVCDKLEKTIAQSLQQAESLRQSILKKAFSGQLLTETEVEETRKAPDWEPAEKLLERIKAEKETQKTGKIK